jgi:hypothetical protein
MWGSGGSAWVVAVRRARLSGLGLLALLLVAASCDRVGSNPRRHLGALPGPAPAAVDPPSIEVETAIVVSSWLAAEHAFDTAALIADPSQPDLAATTVAPQLGATQTLLEEMRSSGEVATGVARYGTPTVRLVGSERAQVVSCLHDAEIVVSAATRKPVPGVLGEVDFELIRSTMELVDGEWKLRSQTVGVGQCSGS